MLRGSQVSSQAEHGGWKSPAASHLSMNMHGHQVFFSPLSLSFSGCSARRWQQVASWATTSSVHLCSGQSGCCHAAASRWHFCTQWLVLCFARSCHIQPVSTGPWEIYTQPLVWGEAVKWAGDMQPYAHMLTHMCAASQKFELFFFWAKFSRMWRVLSEHVER